MSETSLIVDVVKTTNYTKIILDNNDEINVGAANTRWEPIDGDEIIYVYPSIDTKEYRVLFSSGTLNKQGQANAQDLLTHWDDNFFFVEQLRV